MADEAVKVATESDVEVEVVDGALTLAVQEVEGGPGVPVRALVQLMLEP